MRSIIRQARSALPLDLSPDEVCADECRGCSIKLVEYIAMEIDNWEYRLDSATSTSSAAAARKFTARCRKTGWYSQSRESPPLLAVRINPGRRASRNQQPEMNRT
jgi:hypothetical protein